MGILLKRGEDLTGSLSSAVCAASTGMVQREKTVKRNNFYPTLYAAWHLTDNRESQV